MSIKRVFLSFFVGGLFFLTGGSCLCFFFFLFVRPFPFAIVRVFDGVRLVFSAVFCIRRRAGCA